MYDIIIIGAGVAGMTAAIYARRAGKSVCVFEKGAYGEQLESAGKRPISYCATCDGALYKGKPVVVIGSGNTAKHEIRYLEGIASKVYQIHHDEPIPKEAVAGDCRTKNLRQLVTAAGDGAMAATEAVKYLNGV